MSSTRQQEQSSVAAAPGAGASWELSCLSRPSFFFELSRAVGLVPLSRAEPSQSKSRLSPARLQLSSSSRLNCCLCSVLPRKMLPCALRIHLKCNARVDISCIACSGPRIPFRHADSDITVARQGCETPGDRIFGDSAFFLVFFLLRLSAVVLFRLSSVLQQSS